MVAPRSELRLRVNGLAKVPAAGTAVRFSAINDYGATVSLTGSLAP